jgi:hypothetical protein
MEEIRDLLTKNPEKLKLHEKPDTGVYVKVCGSVRPLLLTCGQGLSSFVVKSVKEIQVAWHSVLELCNLQTERHESRKQQSISRGHGSQRAFISVSCHLHDHC